MRECVQQYGNTPLMWACKYGIVEMAKILVEECGANVNRRNKVRVLHCSTCQHRLTPPSPPSPPEQMNETALILATQQNAYGIVKSILRVALRKSIQQKDRVPTKTHSFQTRATCVCGAPLTCVMYPSRKATRRCITQPPMATLRVPER